MIDKLGRNITYLRLSITDRCNLRCRYCMPAEGVCKKSHNDMLTEDEMVTAVEAAAALGITKLRITGGEPLIKRNILSLCRRISAIEGIRDVALTTNGILLPQMAQDLKAAGVNRLNLSLDTLDPERYAYITRIGTLDQALEGLRVALATGFDKIKINAVLIGGFNDDQIRDLVELTRRYPVDMRFIEMMPMYDNPDFNEGAYLPCAKVLEVLPELQETNQDGSVARLYRLPDGQGNVGLISPLSAHFCSECNRIRLTADGKLKPCLHSGDEYSLKGLDFAGMKAMLEEVIWNKPAWHGDLDAAHLSQAGRTMNQIGG